MRHLESKPVDIFDFAAELSGDALLRIGFPTHWLGFDDRGPKAAIAREGLPASSTTRASKTGQQRQYCLELWRAVLASVFPDNDETWTALIFTRA
jgi:hypothetical protein